MAKITGIGGVIRGKSGPNVYRVSKGVQVMSQYNPNPNNPNSDAQLDRRSIFTTAVTLAKAAYLNDTIGRFFRSVSYSDRSLLISKMLKKNINIVSPVNGRLVMGIGSFTNNWNAGFPSFGNILGEMATDEIKVTVSVPNDDSTPPIKGGFIVRVLRPLPEMSEDDCLVASVPTVTQVQAKYLVPDEGVEITQGSEGTFSFSPSEFDYEWLFPWYQVPEGQEITEASPYQAYFFIPVSSVYQGIGLQAEVDGALCSIGNIEYIYQKPTP